MKNNACLLLLFFAIPLLAQSGESGCTVSFLSPYSISATIPMYGIGQSRGKLNAGLHEAENAHKAFRNPALKISLGVVAIAACAAVVIFDNKIKGKADENNRLINEYKALPDNLQYEEYSSKMKDNISSANSYKNIRNGSYILAGLGGVGFAITFAF